MKKQTILSIASISAFVALSMSSNIAFAQYDKRGYSNDKKGYLSKEDVIAQQQTSSVVVENLVEATTPYTGGNSSGTNSTGYATGGAPNTGAGTGGSQQCPQGQSLQMNSFGVLVCAAGQATQPSCAPGFEQVFDQYNRPTCVRVTFDAYSCEQNFHSTFTMLLGSNNPDAQVSAFMSQYNMEARITDAHAAAYAGVTGNLSAARRQISLGCYRLAYGASLILNDNYRRTCYNHIQQWFSGHWNNMDACPSYDEVF